MTTTIKGKIPCPDCGSIEEVKHDSRKYFIYYTTCKTYTHYQTKEAQTRLQARLDALTAFYKTTIAEETKRIKEASEAEAKSKQNLNSDSTNPYRLTPSSIV